MTAAAKQWPQWVCAVPLASPLCDRDGGINGWHVSTNATDGLQRSRTERLLKMTRTTAGASTLDQRWLFLSFYPAGSSF